MSPWVARLLFVVVLSVLPGSQLLVYPVLWLLMPAEREGPDLGGVVPGAPRGR
jgi:phage shock protein C